jgi:hypothetical protein
MIKVYKNKEFHKWAQKVGLTDIALYDAAAEVNNGIFDANLGGNVYKKRVALGGKGKRGGGRTILAFKKNERLFYIYAFKKGDRANISSREERALKELSEVLLNLSDKQIEKLLKEQKLFLLEV